MELHLRRREIALPEVAGVIARIIAQMIVQAIAGMSAGISWEQSGGERSGWKQQR